MVQVGGARKIAVESEGTGNVSLHDPVDQLPKQHPVIVELRPFGVTLFTLLEQTELERIVLPTTTYIVGKQIIVRNLVAIFGMVPKPAHILDQLTIMIEDRSSKEGWKA